jgi:hypothetical protein
MVKHPTKPLYPERLRRSFPGCRLGQEWPGGFDATPAECFGVSVPCGGEHA